MNSKSVRRLMPAQSMRWDHAKIAKMIGDFALVHSCMILAVHGSIIYHLALGETALAQQVTSALARTYLSFVSLSLLFPVVFYSNGFYCDAQCRDGVRKAGHLIRGVAFGMLLFLAADYLLFRDRLVPRSLWTGFCALLMLGIIVSRFLKAEVAKRYEISSRLPGQARPGKVLVVGGAGYIGSILVRDLLAAGHEVRVLDSLVYGDGAIRGATGHHRLELMIGDCRNIQSVVAAVKGCETIIHLAAIVGDPACEHDQTAALQINYASTRMLIEIAKGNSVRRFVFASSCSVYGETDALMTEESSVRPISLYAQTKVDSEDALLKAATDSFHPVILRFATVFGNSYRPRFDLVVNLLTARAIQEGVITIFNGQQWRPFIHVRDVAAAILRVIEAPVSAVTGQIFNVGDSRLNSTLSGVAEKILQIFPETRVESVQNADRRNYRVCFDKIREQLGFEAHYSLEDGITELQKAFAMNAISDYNDPLYNNLKFLQRDAGPAQATAHDGRVMDAFSELNRSTAA